MPPTVRLLPALLLALFTALLTALLLPVGPSVAADPVRVIGHRGYAVGVTENTLASYDRARAAGARGIELDVRVTRDQRLVVMHDDALARTTTCRGALVSASTLAWIQSRCRGVVAGERVPSLDEVAGWLARHRGTTAVVELKEGGWTPSTFRAARNALRAHRVLGRTSVISGSLELLRRAEQAAPALRTHALADSWGEVRAWRRDAGFLDGVVVHAADATPARVRQLRRAGWGVLGRNTAVPADWRRLARAGVEGFVTDRVPEAARVVGSRRRG